MRTFNVEGRDRPFLLSYSALKKITEAGDDFIAAIPKAAFAAFAAGARANKTEVDFTEDDVELWIDLDLSILEAVQEDMVKLKSIFEKKIA
jgi:hypothetical protein